jgi:hypothetical protein
MKKKKPTGERELFFKIWKERPHVCTACNKSLYGEPKVHYFSHILPKSRFPELRLDPDNILIECIECHSDYETKGTDVIRSKDNFQKKLDYIEDKDYMRYCKLKGI